ncbi:thimet oligopeptidase isoform X1 [Hydra vulgaris]|uniref:thimet oligopeptidase isoform X1 n=1 Tax=Hydra vulgaris TaxID=6087 RepID=UPI001F5E44C4|nr:thimet oligopeptidase [Hydra vulgaris]
MDTSKVDIKVQWNLSVEDIKSKVQELIEKTRSVYDYVGSIPADEVNLENVLMTLAYNDYKHKIENTMLDFPQHVSTNKEIRAASTEADKMLSDFAVEMSMREDVFKNLIALQKKNCEMSKEAARYLERLIRNGQRDGLHLSKDTQEEVKRIKKRISDLSIEFNKNCNEENTVFEFTEDELSGLPQDFLNGLKKSESGDKFQVSLKYPDYFPCMKNARNPDVRKILETAFNSRCIKENTPILEELIELRDKKAKILGFENHASFVTEMRMAKTADTVMSFLDELAVKLEPLGAQEVTEMLTLKKEECAKYGYTFDNKINYWDMRYYMNMIEKSKYCIDHEKLKEYFPLNAVITGVLDIYQELLSVTFNEIVDAQTWHSDVSLYSVTDVATNKRMGYFYLDLFPREGKFGHAACFSLQPGCFKENGERMLSVSAMVANFTKPTNDKPSLLGHEEVETFFHEFGHVMHQICAEAEFAIFSGTSVERDFVEAPSQMLENWCWEEAALKRMSKHYKDESELPSDLIDTLVKSRNANAGLFNLRQIALGIFDQLIHTRPSANTADVFAEVSEKVLRISQTPGTNLSASFGHLAGGYDAQYYGYMWSEVYSIDMFHSRFKKEGIFNPLVGMAYRECILKPGGSLDARDMLLNFLGREPNQEAFLISKGLVSS